MIPVETKAIHLDKLRPRYANADHDQITHCTVCLSRNVAMMNEQGTHASASYATSGNRQACRHGLRSLALLE
jgi:hypothetical protein